MKKQALREADSHRNWCATRASRVLCAKRCCAVAAPGEGGIASRSCRRTSGGFEGVREHAGRPRGSATVVELGPPMSACAKRSRSGARRRRRGVRRSQPASNPSLCAFAPPGFLRPTARAPRRARSAPRRRARQQALRGRAGPRGAPAGAEPGTFEWWCRRRAAGRHRGALATRRGTHGGRADGASRGAAAGGKRRRAPPLVARAGSTVWPALACAGPSRRHAAAGAEPARGRGVAAGRCCGAVDAWSDAGDARLSTPNCISLYLRVRVPRRVWGVPF